MRPGYKPGSPGGANSPPQRPHDYPRPAKAQHVHYLSHEDRALFERFVSAIEKLASRVMYKDGDFSVSTPGESESKNSK